MTETGASESGGERAAASGRRSPWAPVLVALAVTVAVLGAITARIVVSGEAEIAASTEALIAGDAHEAVVRARRAAGWYAPGAPHVPVAYERLVALAQAAEEHKRRDLALLAWRGVRSTALETRWLIVPHRAELQRANAEIARLSERAGDGNGDGAPGAMAGQQLALLAGHQAPRLQWVVLLITSFVMVTVGTLWWARLVAGPGGRLRWARAHYPAALVLLGTALWLLALWRA